MTLRKHILAALFFCALAPLVDAQTMFFGKWVDDASGISDELYVSTGGSDANPGIHPSVPFRTLTHALNTARATVAGPNPRRVTINVLPGTYMHDPTINELFPLTMPSFGVSIETYSPTPGDLVTQRALLFGTGPSSNTLIVDSVVNETLAPSVVHGLEFANGALRIDAAALSEPAPVNPIAVAVRACRFRDTSNCLTINTVSGWSERCVVEDNGFAAVDANAGVNGVFVVNSGFSSTLIRSNRFFNFETNIHVDGALGLESRTQPRIFSNFTQLATKNMLLVDCIPWVVNNTVAFAFFPAATVGTVWGISHTGPSIELHNNILWNPLTGSNATLATDFQSSGTVNQSGNLIEDNGGFTPGFIGGDTHPNAYAPVDLHIGNSAAPIDTGNNAAVANLATPLTPGLPVSVGGMTLRRDVPIDVDLDPRIQFSTVAATLTVDVGADEITEVRLARVPNPANPILAMDELGNVVPSLSNPNHNDYTFSVVVTNNSSQVRGVVLMMGFGYLEDPDDFHFVLPWGNFRIDPDPIRSVTFAPTAVAPNSTVTIPIFLGAMPRANREGELRLQAAVLDFASGLGHNTNELRLEWND